MYNILVVDDTPVNQTVAKLMLGRLGHKCDFANNGQLALDLIAEKGIGHYNIIFMDVQMPVLDGLEAASKLFEIYDKVPDIVAMTAKAAPDDKARCFGVGMIGYIAKPVLVDDLEKEIIKNQSLNSNS